MLCLTFHWWNPMGWLLCDRCGGPIWDHSLQLVPPKRPDEEWVSVKPFDPAFLAAVKARWGR